MGSTQSAQKDPAPAQVRPAGGLDGFGFHSLGSLPGLGGTSTPVTASTAQRIKPFSDADAEEVLREEPELRVDKADGKAYNLASFIAEYGGSREAPPSAWLTADVEKTRKSTKKKKKDRVTVTTAPSWNLPPQPAPDPSSTDTTGETTMYGSVEQFKTSKAAAGAAKPNTRSRRPSVEHAQVDDDLYGS